jgi:hypothetical protein
MLEKHWKKFFGCDFPRIPSKYDSGELLELVAECERNSMSKSDRLKIDLVSTHIGSLISLEWKAYASAKAMSVPLSILKSQISEIVTVLRDKKSEMIGHNSVLTGPKQVQLSIRSLASYVSVNEDQQEFYAFISPYTKKPSIRGKPTLRMSIIKQCIESLATTL